MSDPLLLATISRPALASALEAKAPLCVNGVNYPYEYDVPVELPESVVLAAGNAGLNITAVPIPAPEAPVEIPAEHVSPAPSTEGGNGDAAGGDAPGGNPAGSDTDTQTPGFDPEEIIKGKVEQVKERLAGLTLDQLIAVQNAENDREVSRKGVIDAISALLDVNAAPSAALPQA